jgi:hypothetical protein
MTIDPQALNLTTSTTTFNGKKVVASNQSATLSLLSNALVTASVSSQSVPITLAGVNISNAYTNGAAAVAATTTLTFDDDIESTSLSTDPYVQLMAGGQTRTYFGVSTLGVSGSATFTFDKAAVLDSTITLISYMDGVTTTVIFKAAARGTTNGSKSGVYTLFALDDATSTGEPASAIDSAANLAAAINSSNGLPDLEAYANRVSDTDETTANGKVYLKGRDADDGTNTAIALSASTSGISTVTITDFTELNAGDKINLIATDTTNYDFVNGDQSSVAGTWESTSSNAVTATNLMNVINTSSGPAGTRFTASAAVSEVQAVGTVTISSFAELNTGDKVNLVATDGTNYDFVNGDQSSVAGTWESTTSNDATATNLMNVINTSSGPAGTRFTATVLGAVVTVTQATVGAAGNTTVTLTDSGTAGMTKTNFTGGVDTGVVTITQATVGAAGNTVVTLTDSGTVGMTKTDFTGGGAFTDSTSVNPPAAFTGGVDETVDITKNKWSRKGSAENAAESLKDAINDTSSGHGYTDGLTATRSGAVLTITQDVTGTAGNTAVAYNNEFQEICSILPKDFTGGVAADTPKLGIQYSTNGTDWTPTVEIAADVAANVTGIKLFTLPESVTSYPAYRLVFNSDLSTAGTTGRLTFVGSY